MLKYVNTEVVFREVPDEVTLAINISNCPCHCKGCHSSYLAGDIGEELDMNAIRRLIQQNPGITCLSFMGGDADPEGLNYLAGVLSEQYPEIKIAWYSGKDELSKKIDISNFDFIKLGHYDEDLGPLDNPTTNQKFYKVDPLIEGGLENITQKFWRSNEDKI